jgi:hypothetical protein
MFLMRQELMLDIVPVRQLHSAAITASLCFDGVRSGEDQDIMLDRAAGDPECLCQTVIGVLPLLA